jgi:N-acetylglutamate synthase-like GNAT family acetyltransferase
MSQPDTSSSSTRPAATCGCGGSKTERRAGRVPNTAADTATGPVVLERAKPGDAPTIAALLREAGLPHEDFAKHLAHFVVARRGGVLVGAVGAEVCGPDALLRSLVVARGQRGAGLGDALMRRLEVEAATWGVTRWWLLTTTAEAFFVKRGFRTTARSEAPERITATEEFRGLCPSVAVCLSRERR